MLGCPWLTIAGLCLDIVGVLAIAAAAIVSKEEAVERGLAYFAGETIEENLKIPTVQAVLAESKRTRIALGLILVGFALQVVGSWP